MKRVSELIPVCRDYEKSSSSAEMSFKLCESRIVVASFIIK